MQYVAINHVMATALRGGYVEDLATNTAAEALDLLLSVELAANFIIVLQFASK
jgi:hypothetical protein